MGLAGACWNCAQWRYCGIPEPSCRYCEGTGRIIGGDVEGVDPIVVLRAALMALGEGVDRSVLMEKGLLATEATDSLAGPGPTGTGERAALGRQAGKLLAKLGLRQSKTRKVVTPETRAARKKRKAEMAELQRQSAEAYERRQTELANQRRRLKVERAAQAALADAHPEEFEHEREAQEVFVALEEGFGTYMPPAARRVFEGSGN